MGGTAYLDNLFINGNNADDGAGIYNASINPVDSMTVANSNISTNIANSTGGAISNSGNLYLINDTIYGNFAINNVGGGIVNKNDFGASVTLHIDKSTINGNSGYSGEDYIFSQIPVHHLSPIVPFLEIELILQEVEGYIVRVLYL